MTADAVERLWRMLAAPLPPQPEDREAGRAAAALQTEDALQPQPQQRVRLRALRLCGRGASTDDTGRATEERMLAWLAQGPSAAPALMSVRFCHAFSGGTSRFLDEEFRICARRKGLRQLCLGDPGDAAPSSVSSSAIESLAAEVPAGDDAHGTLMLDRPTLEQLQLEQQHQLSLQPFQHLTELSIVLAEASSLSWLARVLPLSVTRLNIGICSNIENGEEHSVLIRLASLGKLRRLRRLSLHLPKYGLLSPFRMCGLDRLTHLRELSINGAVSDLADNALEALLGKLGNLRALTLRMCMSYFSPAALRVIGQALPRLRFLSLSSKQRLSLALDIAFQAPLFPALKSVHFEELEFFGADNDGFVWQLLSLPLSCFPYYKQRGDYGCIIMSLYFFSLVCL
jgi:hypothetical protein